MRTRRETGFTLVELMVVVVILGTLIALVGPNIWNMLFESRRSAADAQMASFGQAIDTYRLANKKLPSSLEELTQPGPKNPHPFMDKVPNDPWGTPYEYRIQDRNKYLIKSYGEDQQADTEDDIIFPKQEDK
jgi:general secretion pathway protein G